MPLPFHRGAWELAKLTPMFIDMCREDETKCHMYEEYIDFCFDNYLWVLYDLDNTIDVLTRKWTETVAARFSMPISYIESVYKNKDDHNSEMRTRYMFKYAMSKGVSGCPTFFVNGVKLNEVPETV